MKLRNLFLTPAAALMAVTMLAPLAIVCVYSLLTRGAYGGVELPWTSKTSRACGTPVYGIIFLRSFWIAAVATALCLVLGFPLAMFIARSGTRKNLYLSLVILPFWTSFLIRTYAWMFLLRDTGIINSILQALGIIREPLPLLYNDGAVILGLVYGFLPFMVLPLFATLERLDPSLLEAAADLGARPWRALVSVTLPLCCAGNPRRRDPGVRAVSGHLPDLRPAGRQQDRAHRQRGPEPIHGLARLALRRGVVAGADGHRDAALVRDPPPRRRTCYEAGPRRSTPCSPTRSCTCLC